MSQSYKKSCIHCNQTIEMSDRKEGKWLPWNLDGTVHECTNRKNEKPKAEQKPEVKPLTLDQIDVRLKKVEKVLFNGGT